MSLRVSVVRWCVGSALAVAAVGCAGRSSIPSDAKDVTSGSGKIAYTADDSGNVYVLDADGNKKVFEGHVRKGDQIVVDPSQDRIVVAGDNADHNVALKSDHRYRIYFKPNS
jgi:hypothetical protein